VQKIANDLARVLITKLIRDLSNLLIGLYQLVGRSPDHDSPPPPPKRNTSVPVDQMA
jgi:hypothetical protein